MFTLDPAGPFTGLDRNHLTGDRDRLDASIVTFWRLVAPDAASAALGILRTRWASTSLVSHTFDTAAHVGVDIRSAELAAVKNPAMPLGVLRSWLFHSRSPGLSRKTAENAAIGEWAAEMYRALPGATFGGFLANVACPTDVIAERWEIESGSAVANPAAPEHLVAFAVESGAYPEVWRNPTVDPSQLRETLRTGDQPRRAQAARNPTLTDDELIETFERERTGRFSSRTVLTVAEEHLRVRRYAADPLSCPASDLRSIGFHPVVGDAFAGIGSPVTAEAVSALLRSGFGGTVAELLDVASTVTT